MLICVGPDHFLRGHDGHPSTDMQFLRDPIRMLLMPVKLKKELWRVDNKAGLQALRWLIAASIAGSFAATRSDASSHVSLSRELEEM